MANPKEVMTLGEVALYLKLAEKTVLRMAHRGQIPCAKVGSQWRFIRSMIDEWLMARMKGTHRTELSRLIESKPDIVPLSRLVRPELVRMDLQPGSKRDVLRQLVQPLVDSGVIRSGEAFVARLMERENIAATTVSRGVAIPHLRHPREYPAGPVLAVGVCREGTDFQAPDGEKTHLVFLLVTDSEVVHLRVLAKLGRILRQDELLSRMLRAATREELIGLVIQADQVKSLLARDHASAPEYKRE